MSDPVLTAARVQALEERVAKLEVATTFTKPVELWGRHGDGPTILLGTADVTWVAGEVQGKVQFPALEHEAIITKLTFTKPDGGEIVQEYPYDLVIKAGEKPTMEFV